MPWSHRHEYTNSPDGSKLLITNHYTAGGLSLSLLTLQIKNLELGQSEVSFPILFYF